jgi:ribosomal protein L16/L10AE
MTDEVKRDVKNTVFVDLFNQDEYRLQLFQTLHPEITDVTADELQIITIKRVITNHQYNDLAFVFRNKLMIFVEAQSTWSINILIRLLLYLAETIQEYMHERNMKMHAKGKQKIPMPEFYVIFTGTDEIPKRISLKKDFFCSELCQIDLEAKVYNVETDDIIGQYIIFCHVMDEQIKKYGRVRKAALETLRICRDRNVLKKYLEEREKEVVNIMIELFNQESAVKEYGEERREEGWKEGWKEGIEEGVQLFAKLFELGNPEELEKALKDPEYRKKLLKDYGLAED